MKYACIIKKWRLTLNSDVIVRGSSYNYGLFSLDFATIFIQMVVQVEYFTKIEYIKNYFK